MASWIYRLIKGLLMLLVVLTVAIVGLFTFGPVSFSTLKFGINEVLGLEVNTPSELEIRQRLKVPDGFSIGKYATGLKKVRFMEFTRNGDLIVSQPREGRVVLLKKDANGDGVNDGEIVLLDNLRRPHGLEFYQNYLYIAESNAIGRVVFDHQNGSLSGDYETIIDNLPDNGNHWTKSIRINDSGLYISIGSSCNVCEEEDIRRATIMRYEPDGSNGKIFADGLRNSVGMDFSPWDGKLYATDNGRDMLGDDYPVCELNHIVEGGFYGWPYINAFGDIDPDLGLGKEPLLGTAISPEFGFRSHNAPLGMRFMVRSKLPAGFERSALVALHGSWNRREPDGYKVVSLHWRNDGAIESRDFFSGFEHQGNIIGRPVDVAEGHDGCVYVSDDYAGIIYRICYGAGNVAYNDDTPVRRLNDAYKNALSNAERSQSVRRGAAIYEENSCSECHQLEGKGNAQGKELFQLALTYTSDSLANYFLTPNPPMPQYELTEQQRLDLAVFLLEVGG